MSAGRLGPRAALALLLLAVVPYLNALAAGFTFDDVVVVRDDPRLASPARAGEIFTSGHFGAPLATAKNYRPFALLTFALQRWTTGKDPLPFHAVNVALHAATTLLLAAWLLSLGMPRGPSLAAAALFAVLPVHAEAVTGVVGRFELLVALLVLASALLFRRATDGPRLATLPYAGALLAFLAALLSKENAVVLPGVVALGELLRRDVAEPLRPRLSQKALPFAGLLVPLAAFAAFRVVFVGSGLVGGKGAFFDLDNPLAPLPGPLRAANALVLLLRYVAQAFVPLGLSADHSAHALDLVSSLAGPRALAGLAGVALLAAAGLASARRNPLVALGTGLFLGAFLPTSNLLFPIGTIYADRLSYLPSAGLLAAAAGAVAAAPRLSGGFRAALLAVVLAAYAGTTFARNEVFRDDESLFADTVAKVPRSARARYGVAIEAWDRGETLRAERSVRTAVAIFPRYYDAWTLLGLAADRDGRTDEARRCLREALRIKPDDERALRALARIEEESGRFAEAERLLLDGLRRFPRSRPLLERRAAFLDARGRHEEALAVWRSALAEPGAGAPARLGLAHSLAALGRDGEAFAEARRAVTVAPASLEPRLLVAEIHEKAGRPVAAARELADACRARPRDPVPARRLLELALRERRARGVAQSALAGIERAFGRPARNLALREAIDAFRSAAR